MSTITTRAGKGSALTNAEIDANFTALNADKVETSALTAHLDDTSDAHDASAISNVAAGGIVATTVQAAIDELDTEKAPKASPEFSGTATFTGPVSVTGEGNLSVVAGVIGGFVSSGDYLSVAGFSALGSGNTPIKIKQLTGTTNASEGGNTQVAHGLTGAKILGVTCVVEHATNSGVPPGGLAAFAGYKYDCYFNATYVIVYNHPTESENILSKPFRVLVVYEE